MGEVAEDGVIHGGDVSHAAMLAVELLGVLMDEIHHLCPIVLRHGVGVCYLGDKLLILTLLEILVVLLCSAPHAAMVVAGASGQQEEKEEKDERRTTNDEGG